MALCITDTQKKVLDYYRTFFKANGVFPNTSDAARILGKSPQAITSHVGALFLKGAFTDGKPLTPNLSGQHTNSKSVGLKMGTSKPKATAKSANIDDLIRQEIAKYFRNITENVSSTLNE